jgi:catechol 2,3-dioxygenase-like lactoylglutathione lyase family enzyme
MNRFVLVCVAAGAMAGVPLLAQEPVVKLTTVAYRVHKQEAMVAFYSQAFGAKFREVQTGAIRSQFGELPGLTLKFVPIRAAVDFEEFPVHQLGFEVANVERVMALAVKHGGRVQDAPTRTGNRTHASVRDPDGNTIELYSGR